MPTLNWIGKEAVINHHHDVPFKTLDKKYTFVNGETIVDDGKDAKSCINDGKDAKSCVNDGKDAKSCVNDGKDAKSCVNDGKDAKSCVSTTENKIIHGDNLEALKALLPEYEGRIKCIYIDPPYNTGNENWVYNDNVNSPRIRKWLGQVVGKEAEDLTRHDKWLCMMYPRLKLLHKLLADDGAIFISIDDNEQANLKLICDEIFGAKNFVAQVIWERAYAPINLKKHFSESHDYIICYAKKINELVCNGLPRKEETNSKYKNPDNDPRGLWRTDNLAVGPIVEEQVYEITTPSGRKVMPPKGYCWRLTKERFAEFVADNRIWFGENGDLVPAPKRFLTEVKQSMTPMTIWKYSEVGHSQDAMRALRAIFDGEVVFDYPKSVDLIKRCLELYSDQSSIILDSFAGSGTTAHAVLNLNKQDGGNRKFILVEMEDYAETITAERVRRVISGYGRDAARHVSTEGTCVSTEGTGGAFTYYELGEPIMNGDYLNENQPIEKIREYIWYTETCVPYCRRDAKFCVSTGTATGKSDTHMPADNPYYLGNHNNAGYYFYYEKNTTTTLDKAFLNTISQPADQYIIYADNCLLSDEFMRLNNIVFKKIPRDIRKF